MNPTRMKGPNIRSTQEFYKALKETSRDPKVFLQGDNHFIQLLVDAIISEYENKEISVEAAFSVFRNALLNANKTQATVVADGFVRLLIAELKMEIQKVKHFNKYRSRYQLNHPLSWLILENRNESVDLLDIFMAVFDNPDSKVRRCSYEFMHPFVFQLFESTSVRHSSELKLVWNFLLNSQNPEATRLITELIPLANFQDNPKFWFDILVLTYNSLDPDSHPNDGFIGREIILLMTGQLRYLIKSHHNLTTYLGVILKMIQQNVYFLEDCWETVLCGFADLIKDIPVRNLPEVMGIITTLIGKPNCGTWLTVNVIMDSIIQWVLHPVGLSSKTCDAFEAVIKYTRTKKYASKAIGKSTQSELNYKRYFVEMTDIHYTSLIAIDLNDDSKKLVELVRHLKTVSKDDLSSASNLNILRSIMLSHETNATVLSETVDIMKQLPIALYSSFLMPLLFKLVHETDAQQQLAILQFLPEFGAIKENVPIILTTLRKFERVPILDIVCLELYYKLWKSNYRTLSHLMEQLNHVQQVKRKRKNQHEINLALISIIYQICLQNPNPDLVKSISDILNDTCDSRDGMATCIVLHTIQLLCESRTINIISTWDAIKSKFRSESRTNVLEKMCEFFSIIPSLRIGSVEYETFESEIMALLWDNILHSVVVGSSFRALAKFPWDTFKLIKFPERFREKLKLPKSHLREETEEMQLANFPYIPGECWIQMLQKIPPKSLESASILIGAQINQELLNFRGGVFVLAEGRDEPQCLNGVTPKSVLKALLEFLVVEVRTEFAENELICMFILKCLAYNPVRSLPPFDWSFLQSVHDRTMEMRAACLKLACQQMPSKSATKLVSRCFSGLNVNEKNDETLAMIVTLLESLPKLAAAVPLNEIEIFLRSVLEHHSEAITDMGSSFVRIFKAIKMKDLDVDLKFIIEDVMIKLYQECPFDSKEFDVLMELLDNMDESFIERATSIRDDVHEGVLKKALSTRLMHFTRKSLDLEVIKDIIDTYLNRKPTFIDSNNYYLCAIIDCLELIRADTMDKDRRNQKIHWLMAIAKHAFSQIAKDEQRFRFFCLLFIHSVISFADHFHAYGQDMDINAIMEMYSDCYRRLNMQFGFSDNLNRVNNTLMEIVSRGNTLPNDLLCCLRNGIEWKFKSIIIAAK